VSDRVALRLPLTGVVVTWFVTGSRIFPPAIGYRVPSNRPYEDPPSEDSKSRGPRSAPGRPGNTPLLAEAEDTAARGRRYRLLVYYPPRSGCYSNSSRFLAAVVPQQLAACWMKIFRLPTCTSPGHFGNEPPSIEPAEIRGLLDELMTQTLIHECAGHIGMDFPLLTTSASAANQSRQESPYSCPRSSQRKYAASSTS